jgi:hypothetical protein
VPAGERVALVSDAGLPGVNDPGARLIRAVAAAGLDVTVLPGPSSVETASSSADCGTGYRFVGYCLVVRGLSDLVRDMACGPRQSWVRVLAAFRRHSQLWRRAGASCGGLSRADQEPKRLLADAAGAAARFAEPPRRVTIVIGASGRFSVVAT